MNADAAGAPSEDLLDHRAHGLDVVVHQQCHGGHERRHRGDDRARGGQVDAPPAARGDHHADRVRAEPFAEVELELAALWDLPG